MNSDKKKLLILIVAFNHERFIKKVLNRFDQNLSKKYDVEILINDDSSTDKTVEFAKEFIKNNPKSEFKYKILSNPENQGYGGNQKIGYHYAIKNNFDFVALVHGDGQYAPEYLEELVEPLNLNKADAVFGSRMIIKGGALKGGMPLYKFLGNKILTFYQNSVFSTNFTEFHSGYRIYKVDALKKIPFQINSNDYSFDNEIIVQFLIAKLIIKEKAIPTYYGEEISYVNGMMYAYQVFKTNFKAKLQELGIFYDLKFDCAPENENNYVIKKNFISTHTVALKNIDKNSKILDLGCNEGKLLEELKAQKNCDITGVDKYDKSQNNQIENYISFDLENGLPDLDYKNFDYILILDVVEHLSNPEKFISELKNKLNKSNNVKVFISTPNIGFIIIRFMLLFGFFNYGKRGILDKTHKRLFTFSTLKSLLVQNDFKITKSYGIPAPFPLAVGENFLSKILININTFLIKISKNLFSFQIFYEVKPNISLETLLDRAKENIEKKN